MTGAVWFFVGVLVTLAFTRLFYGVPTLPGGKKVAQNGSESFVAIGGPGVGAEELQRRLDARRAELKRTGLRSLEELEGGADRNGRQ
jgi:hypothetical protein